MTNLGYWARLGTTKRLSGSINCGKAIFSRLHYSGTTTALDHTQGTLLVLRKKDMAILNLTTTAGGDFHTSGKQLPPASLLHICDFGQQTAESLCKTIKLATADVRDVAIYSRPGGARIARQTSLSQLCELNQFAIKLDDRYCCFRKPERNDKMDNDIKSVIGALYSSFESRSWLRRREAALLADLAELERQLQPMEQLKTRLTRSTQRRVSFALWAGLIGLAAQFSGLARLTWFDFSWDIMEPVTFFISAATGLGAFGYFILTAQLELCAYKMPGTLAILTCRARPKVQNFACLATFFGTFFAILGLFVTFLGFAQPDLKQGSIKLFGPALLGTGTFLFGLGIAMWCCLHWRYKRLNEAYKKVQAEMQRHVMSHGCHKPTCYFYIPPQSQEPLMTKPIGRACSIHGNANSVLHNPNEWVRFDESQEARSAELLDFEQEQLSRLYQRQADIEALVPLELPSAAIRTIATPTAAISAANIAAAFGQANSIRFIDASEHSSYAQTPADANNNNSIGMQMATFAC